MLFFSFVNVIRFACVALFVSHALAYAPLVWQGLKGNVFRCCKGTAHRCMPQSTCSEISSVANDHTINPRKGSIIINYTSFLFIFAVRKYDLSHFLFSHWFSAFSDFRYHILRTIATFSLLIFCCTSHTQATLKIENKITKYHLLPNINIMIINTIYLKFSLDVKKFYLSLLNFIPCIHKRNICRLSSTE